MRDFAGHPPPPICPTDHRLGLWGGLRAWTLQPWLAHVAMSSEDCDHDTQTLAILLEVSAAWSPSLRLPVLPPQGQAFGTHGVSGFSFLSWETWLPSFSLEHRAGQG